MAREFPPRQRLTSDLQSAKASLLAYYKTPLELLTSQDGSLASISEPFLLRRAVASPAKSSLHKARHTSQLSSTPTNHSNTSTFIPASSLYPQSPRPNSTSTSSLLLFKTVLLASYLFASSMTASHTSAYALDTRSNAARWIEAAKRGGSNERRGEERGSIEERKVEKVVIADWRMAGEVAGRWERGVYGRRRLARGRWEKERERTEASLVCKAVRIGASPLSLSRWVNCGRSDRSSESAFVVLRFQRSAPNSHAPPSASPHPYSRLPPAPYTSPP